MRLGGRAAQPFRSSRAALPARRAFSAPSTLLSSTSVGVVAAPIGWITDARTAPADPHGAHYGSAWREVDPEQAEAIAAEGWTAEGEFARIAAFFAEIGCR